jgi:hypothetical protein
VLKGTPGQLENGHDCTKEIPTSVPAKRKQSSLPFHLLRVGKTYQKAPIAHERDICSFFASS